MDGIFPATADGPAQNLRRTRDVARGGVVRYLKGSAAQTRSTFQGGRTRNGGVAFILDSDETEPSSKSAFRARNARFVCGIASGTKCQFRSSAANRSLTALGSNIPDKTEAPIKVPGTCVTLPPARLPHLRAPPQFEFAPFWGVRITRGLERGTPDQILRDFASAVGVIDGAGGGERGPDVQKGTARDGLHKRISGCLRAIDTLQVGSQSNSPTEASSIFIPLLVPSLLIPAHDALPRTTFTFRGFGFSRWLACAPSLFGVPGSIPPEFGLLCLPRHAYPPPKHFGAGFGGPANGPTIPPPSPDSTYRRPASGASVTNFTHSTRIPWSADSSFPSVSDGAGPIFDSIIISTATPSVSELVNLRFRHSIPQHLQFDFGRLASEDHPAALRHNTLPSRERVISRLSKPLKSGPSSLRGPGFWSDFLHCAALRGAFGRGPSRLDTTHRLPASFTPQAPPSNPLGIVYSIRGRPASFQFPLSTPSKITAEPRHDIPPSAKIPTLSALQNRENLRCAVSPPIPAERPAPNSRHEVSNPRERAIYHPRSASNPAPQISVARPQTPETMYRCPASDHFNPFKSPKSPLRGIPTNSRRAPNFQLATRSVEPPRARYLPPQERIESRPSHSSNPQNAAARAQVSCSKPTPLNRGGKTASRIPKILHFARDAACSICHSRSLRGPGSGQETWRRVTAKGGGRRHLVACDLNEFLQLLLPQLLHSQDLPWTYIE
ncbi:hypothetical protein DFH09DRAFT_1099119 [Mycena vulgaris]|nr:hypothetical protein DFH09DRAFT_1099119 [Mycena vulgaris]